jgi:hypothetical protein
MARKVLDQNGFSLTFVFLDVKGRIHPAADIASIHTCVMDTEIDKKIKNQPKKQVRN